MTGDGRVVQGRRTDGQERDRLRPAAPVRRFARHARRARAGDAAVPAAARVRAVVHGADGDAPCTGPSARLVGRRARDTCCSKARRPTSTAQGRGLDRGRRPPALPDGAHRGRISVAPGRVRGVRTRAADRRALVRGARRRHRARRGRRRAGARARPARSRTRTAAGCCAKPAARPTTTATAAPLPNVDGDAPDQGRVRPRPDAATRAAAAGGPVKSTDRRARPRRRRR